MDEKYYPIITEITDFLRPYQIIYIHNKEDHYTIGTRKTDKDGRIEEFLNQTLKKWNKTYREFKPASTDKRKGDLYLWEIPIPPEVR